MLNNKSAKSALFTDINDFIHTRSIRDQKELFLHVLHELRSNGREFEPRARTSVLR